MSNVLKVDYEDVGVKIDNGYVFTFAGKSSTEHILVYGLSTDANPYIIYGDFRDVKYFVTLGMYQAYDATQSSTAREWSGRNNITFGTQYLHYCGKSSVNSYTSYRHITIYEDRIEIGQGYYNTGAGYVAQDGYGGFELLVLSNMAIY